MFNLNSVPESAKQAYETYQNERQQKQAQEKERLDRELAESGERIKNIFEGKER